MQKSFALEAFIDLCAEIKIHLMLAQFEEQLIELILM